MAVPYVGQTLLTRSARTKLELTPPEGAKANDVLVVHAYLEANKVLNAPTGGTEFGSQAFFTSFRQASFWVVYDGSTKPVITWEGGASTNCIGSMIAVRGADLSSPIDAQTGFKSLGASTEFNAESLTASVAGDLDAIMVVNGSIAEPIKESAGFTRVINYSPGVLEKEGLASGATGTQVVKLASSVAVVYQRYLIKPAGGTSVTIEPPAAVAKAVAAAPTIETSSSSSVTIEPPAAVAKAKAVAPAVSTVASVTIEPPAAVAKAVAPAPTVTAEGGEAPVVRRPNRKPPLALDVEVESAGGQTIRFPADSAKARFKPRGLSHGTQRGDGFTTASFSVSREIFREFEVRLLDTVRFVGHNGEVAYEGFVGSMPRTNDPEQSITINVQGWMTYLKGRQIPPLIIDRRLSGWTEPSIQRKTNMLLIGERFEGALSSGWQYSGATGAAVLLSYSTFDGSYIELGEAWIYAGGQDIGQLRFDFARLEGSLVDADWHSFAYVSSDDLASSYDPSSEFHVENFAGGYASATVPGRKYAFLQSYYTGAGTGTVSHTLAFLNPRIIGTHGLTSHGAWPEEGYYLSDILRYVIQTYYPKLTWAGEENQTLVTQCTRHDSPTDGYEFTQELNNLALWETNVWEERKLHFYPADLTRYDWQIRTDDPGVTVQFQGDSIENFANGVSVSYTDVLTEKAVMLWPDENAELRDESETNPANVQGINNWTSTQVPWTCTEAEALQFGRAYLAEFNRPKRPGTYTISGGYIKDAAGHWHQGWKPRSSETVGIMDLEFDEPRLITATSWDQESLTLTLTVDAPPQLLEAVIARQQRALESRGLS